MTSSLLIADIERITGSCHTGCGGGRLVDGKEVVVESTYTIMEDCVPGGVKLNGSLRLTFRPP